MDSLLPSDGQVPQHATGKLLLKMGVVLSGGSCLVLLAIVAASDSTPKLRGVGAGEPTNLIGLPTALHNPSAVRGPAPMLLGGGLGSRNLPSRDAVGPALPGRSPWKELALAAMEGANSCNRDVSMKAQNGLQAVMASMDSRSRVIVNAAANRAREMAGITGPMGFFDPLGFSADVSQGRLLFFREVELKHGRICMLAALGILVAEQFHPLFGGDIDVPAYIAFQKTPLQTFWIAVAAAIAIPEVLSIQGYKDSSQESPVTEGGFAMKTDRVPGDLGFDPLGLKPADGNEFLQLQNREINNGRLAMISVAGMIAQELATGQKLFP